MPFGIDPLYRLRWRFDFADGKTKRGMWSNPGKKPEESAWANNKPGLIHACIESESQTTWEIENVVECDGHDFVEFRWVMAVQHSPLGLTGEVTIPGTVIGLELITREKRATAIIDGKLTVRERTTEERKNNLDQYRK